MSVGTNAFVFAFAKSSSRGSGGSDDGGDKPKTSGNKKGDSGGMPVPCSPAVRVDNKRKDKDNNGGGRLIVPGSPVVTADGDIGNGNNGGGIDYNNEGGSNIKKFDPSKSVFSIGGTSNKVVEYRPGFNETFYNSTLLYCYAVTSGSCYNSSTGQILP